MRITLMQIEAFYWTARLGGVHAASRHLHLTQPAISSRIREMESLLSVKLFDRSKQRMIITADGLIALQHAELALNNSIKLEQFAAKQKHNRRLRVGADECSAMVGLTAVIAEIKAHFPEITLGDIVRAQRLLVRHLGIAKLHAVVGGSMGGMQALIWCADYQAEVGRIAVLAAGLSQSPMAIALNAVSRACVERDPHFRGGHYAPSEGPDSGLAVGRMIAHISYLSSASFEQKFGRAKVPGAGAGDADAYRAEAEGIRVEEVIKRLVAGTKTPVSA